MKLLMKYPAVFLAVVLLAQPATTSEAKIEKKSEKKTSEKGGVDWMRYDEGLALARKEGKQILVDFTASWCGWCKRMEREAFSDSSIIDMLNNQFVPIRVDGDSKKQLNIEGYIITEKELTAQEYGVRGYPMFWFLESDGSRIGPLRGYQKIEPFMNALIFIKERKYETSDDTGTKKGSTGGK